MDVTAVCSEEPEIDYEVIAEECFDQQTGVELDPGLREKAW